MKDETLATKILNQVFNYWDGSNIIQGERYQTRINGIRTDCTPIIRKEELILEKIKLTELVRNPKEGELDPFDFEFQDEDEINENTVTFSINNNEPIIKLQLKSGKKKDKQQDIRDLITIGVNKEEIKKENPIVSKKKIRIKIVEQ